MAELAAARLDVLFASEIGGPSPRPGRDLPGAREKRAVAPDPMVSSSRGREWPNGTTDTVVRLSRRPDHLARVRHNAGVTPDNAEAWDRHSAAYQAVARLTTASVQYGPDVPAEDELRLLGNVKDKRVLELGCGGAHACIAVAKQGAHAIGVDFSAEQLAHARHLMDREKVRVELHHGDLADLAFIRADAIDLALSTYAFNYVENLDRVFRQVNRVLKPEAPLVFSLPHPCYDMFDHHSPTPMVVRRSYFDRSPIEYELNGVPFTDYRHTMGDLFAALGRANFRVEAIVEPEPVLSGPRPAQDSLRFVPPTLIMRAKKQGR